MPTSSASSIRTPSASPVAGCDPGRDPRRQRHACSGRSSAPSPSCSCRSICASPTASGSIVYGFMLVIGTIFMPRGIVYVVTQLWHDCSAVAAWARRDELHPPRGRTDRRDPALRRRRRAAACRDLGRRAAADRARRSNAAAAIGLTAIEVPLAHRAARTVVLRQGADRRIAGRGRFRRGDVGDQHPQRRQESRRPAGDRWSLRRIWRSCCQATGSAARR